MNIRCNSLSLVVFLTLLCSSLGFGQSVIKTMFYNVLNYPTAPPSNREVYLETIIDSYEPDLFMICELENETGADEILNDAMNDDGQIYSRAPFLSNFSNSDVELHQIIFFNNKKLKLLNSERISNTIRDINWYTLQFITENQETNPIYLEVFVAHLKASQGIDNENKRLEMVEGFIDNLPNLAEDAYVLFAGDFNLYSSDEPAYQALLNPDNPIIMVDPINTPGDWHTNSTFSDLHTQSTRLSNNEFDNFGAGGGLDDRFDFIMMSQNLSSDPVLHYNEGSYAAYGNNENCYNKRIDDAECTGTYSSELRQALYQVSDHLPVVMELTLEEALLSTYDFNYISASITLEPNLVENQLNVRINSSGEEIFFDIYNVLGQKLRSFSASNGIKTISIDNLAEGLYYLKPLGINHKTLKFYKKT
ncbi:hypothetical protein [Aquimarina brevivitae]|uniref:Putative secreted protein (Por secretion system target) n=1 Tax=Aquimarina brevivitae TaxID=323412 RepID=A0A4Q7P2W6_9FLAO|nr:hypothetical protein [Aquimarina brevivitae]RZS93698.1 putative secreted protein (Por secretion system target) [Aquimarina brevivitae]